MDTRQYAECGGCGRLYNTNKENEIVEMDTHECNPSDYSTCKECGEDERTDDLNDAMLCRYCACTHERVECPSHEGNFDCNPFCRLCEGDQEYCPICEEQQ